MISKADTYCDVQITWHVAGKDVPYRVRIVITISPVVHYIDIQSLKPLSR